MKSFIKSFARFRNTALILAAFMFVFPIQVQGISNSDLSELRRSVYLMDNGQEEQGFRVLEGLANRGVAEAQFILATIYGDEENEQNEQEAFRWMLKSAERGYAPAQLFVGRMYEEGMGVRKNPQESAKWYQRAANQGIRSWEDLMEILERLME